MSNFSSLLKRFLHDPIDKPFDISTHSIRAKEYANILGVSGLEEAGTSDQIASCMERSLVPSGVKQEFNEIRHPLCEEKLGVSYPDINEVASIVKDTLKRITEQIYHYNDKNKFFYLWRNLFEMILEKTKNKSYSKFWSVIPADTRVPDHSIWEHLKISAAINAFGGFQNNSIFLFTLGPVQSFISQARKAQDLFCGSFILSYLTFVGITEIINEHGPTSVIYPDLYAQPLMDWYIENEIKIDIKSSSSSQMDMSTIPNRFVAIIPETDKLKIAGVANRIINKVKNEWNEISNKVLSSFEINKDEKIKKQLNDFPQIYWVAVPWRKGDKDITIDDLSAFVSGEETESLKKLFEFASKKGEFKPNIGLLYQFLYTCIEKSIRIRKNLRDFYQRKEYGKKCSICGEKEGIIKPGMGKLEIGKFISEKEALCGICFVKRGFEKYFHEKFDKKLSFPSTAEVALSNFLKKIDRNMYGKYRDLFDKEDFDPQLLYEENLTEDYFKKDIQKLDKAKEYQKKIVNDYELPRYYAILMLDGDNMGKWLSGELLPSIEYSYNSEVWEKLPDDFKNELKKIAPQKILTPAIHSAVSAALRNYSIEFVKKIVEEEHLGKIVYSGGDDLLAFVNLKDLFAVIRKLRAAFSGQIKFQGGKIEVDWENQTSFVEKDNKLLLIMGKRATASMGVVIAHYKMPLRIVLTKLKEMKDKAKSLPNKDAFCIALLKHSGEERIGYSKWLDGNRDVVAHLEELGNLMVKKDNEPYFSDRFIYNLRKEFLKLTDDGRWRSRAEIFNVELKRLISRAYNGPKDKKKEIIEKVYNLKEIFWSTDANVQNFLHLLEVTSFISREGKE